MRMNRFTVSGHCIRYGLAVNFATKEDASSKGRVLVILLSRVV